jgi:hypothetical protein
MYYCKITGAMCRYVDEEDGSCAARSGCCKRDVYADGAYLYPCDEECASYEGD